jgi:hypothetical protein
MTHGEHKDLKAFLRKRRQQDAAGFGAAPPMDAGKIWNETQPASTPPEDKQANAPTVDRSRSAAAKSSPCSLGDRILTGLAILSLGMLMTGAIGAYLSNGARRVAATARSESAASSASRVDELQRRMTQLDELYGKRLQALDTQVTQAMEPYDARLRAVEDRLKTPAAADEAGRLQALESRLDRLDASAYEARLTAIENRLDQTYAPEYAGLQNMEDRRAQGYAGYDARLRQLESRLMQLQIPYQRRLHELERRLAYASARLDYLSARMESFTSDNAGVMQANARLHANPPAAVPAATPDAAPAAPWFQPAPQPIPPAITGTVQADERTGRTPFPVVTTLPGAASLVAAEALADDVPPPPANGEPEAEPTDEARDAAVMDQTSATANTQTPPAPAHATPDEATPDSRGEDNPEQSATGVWTINLASYASKGIASRKLADFGRKGVRAEQAVATVHGKTIYRVRVAGFDSYKAAMAQAETIRQQLGLKEIWVTKR